MILYLKNGRQVRKMQTAAGGPIHYSRTMTTDNLSKAANYVGEYVLKGFGALGKFLNAGFTSPTYGTTGQVSYARNAEDAKRLREQSEASEQAMGKAMTWVSPLNYGAALATGNGLDARKGEEEVASWSPAWQAVGRLGELYVGPKAVKGAKSVPRIIVNTAAKAGVKPARATVIAREINGATKLGIQNINLRPKILIYDLLANNYGFPKSFKLLGAESEQRAFLGNDGYVYKIPKYGASDGTFVTKNMNINRLPNDLGAKTEFLGIRKNPDGTKTPIIRLEYVDPIKSRLLYLDLMKDYNYDDKLHFILFDNEGFVDDIRPSNVGTINGKLKIFDIGTYKTPKSIQKPVTKTTRQEPSTSLAFFEKNPFKNNIVGASLDYSMEDSKGIDFIKQFFALLRINGKEYTLEGLKDATNVQQGLPEHIQSYLNLNTVERAVRAMRKNGYSEREILLYVDKVNEEMNKVRVGMYSDLEYNAAGALGFGGFYNNDLNFISVNKDAYLSKPNFTPNYILKHEGRHLIDYNTSMTDDVINILEKAYDKDFLEIPKHEDAGNLKDYQHMNRERVTTNRDARDVLLSNLEKHPGEFLNLTKFAQTSFGKNKDMIDFLNGLILYAEPEDIISAVENSNGYGKRYINYLRKNNKLTSDKIELLRLAMIHVPSYLLPVAGGYTLYNLFNLPLQQLQYLKQGGKINAIELFKQGSKIHIKKKNRGKFTAYCGGNVTSACIAKAKASGNPTLIKRATFAANARKWKHQLGGTLYKYLVGGYIQPQNVLEAIANGSAANGILEGFGRIMNKILPSWMLKVGTYLSPLNYAAALSKGSINPKVGEKVISKWHPNLLLVARTGEAVFGGKAIKNTPKAVVNTAAKAGNKTARAYLISKEIGKGKINLNGSEIPVDLSNASIILRSPFGWWEKVKVLLSKSSKQLRVVSEGTYPIYRGKQHSVREVVNPDGTVNPRQAMRIQHEVSRQFPGSYKMEHRFENPEWHPTDPTTYHHTRNVARSAWYIDPPLGFTKQDLMIAALGHDFGKIVAGDGHAQIGADLARLVFPDLTDALYTAIAQHMGNPTTPLGKVTKQADITNGRHSYSGYTPTKLNLVLSKFVRDVMLGYRWGKNKEIKPIGSKDFTEQLKGKKRLGYGAESNVYEDISNPNQVLKIPSNGPVTPHNTLKGAIREGLFITTPFNRLPYNLPLNVEGAVRTSEGKYIPVFSQRKVYIPLIMLPKINDFDRSVNGMYSYFGKPDINNILSENDIPLALDFKLENIGLLPDGTVMGIDLWKKGGKLCLIPRN